MRGKHLNRWIALLCLATIAAISLACSSGADLVESAGAPSTDVFGKPLPPSVKGTFVAVPGGSFVLGSNYAGEYLDENGNNASFTDGLYERVESAANVTNTEELNDGVDDLTFVNSFLMMKTEVTVQMFVDFLNAIAKNSDSLSTVGDGGGASSFTLAVDIYKPVMQQLTSCGIYRKEFGVQVNDEITDFSGFYIEQGKPNGDIYIDPFVQLQKPRSEVQTSSFEAAPSRGNYPMVYVSQDEAKEFCRWLGSQYRLPTWQEWTWAGRGGQDYQFPTANGNIFANGSPLAHFQYKNTEPEGTKNVVNNPTFANPYGLYDLAGSVWEWTYFKAEDQSAAATIPYDPYKFLVGGSFKTKNPGFLTTWYRYGYFASGVWADDLGFRVIFDKTRGNSISNSENVFVPGSDEF